MTTPTLPARLLSDIDDLLSAVPAKIHDETRWVRDACAALREAAAALSVPDGREVVAWRVKNLDGNWMYFDFKPDYLENAQPLYTTPPPGGGVVEANALSADELVELDKLVADVGPQQALNMFVELRAAIAGKVDEADRSIAELKRRTAAPSAKGV